MQKKWSVSLLALVGVLTFALSSCDDDDHSAYEERVVVANRASGSLSFIDAVSDEVISTLVLPDAEPMYVVYVRQTDKVYVGDRRQNAVHVIDPDTRNVVQSIAVGQGVFHMWADGKGRQLWVNNDIDNTISVIDLRTHQVVHTISLSVKPHDVFLTREGQHAYVSVINPNANEPDSIFMFSTKTKNRVGAKAVGKDPHVFHLSKGNQLLVPCQSGQLFVLKGNTLATIDALDLEGAHGIFAAPDQREVVITNISGQQLYYYDAIKRELVTSPAQAANPIPHNVAINAEGSKAFVTHSGGTANTVSIYSLTGDALEAEETLTVGNNPFGLAYYVRKAPEADRFND